MALTRFAARDALEKTLAAVLRDKKHQQAFELSDGSRTQSEVGDLVGLGQSAISDLWKRWRRLGLLQERSLRMARIVSLIDLGWDVPLPNSPKTRQRRAPLVSEEKE